jgi:hypothetical protein
LLVAAKIRVCVSCTYPIDFLGRGQGRGRKDVKLSYVLSYTFQVFQAFAMVGSWVLTPFYKYATFPLFRDEK